MNAKKWTVVLIVAAVAAGGVVWHMRRGSCGETCGGGAHAPGGAGHRHDTPGAMRGEKGAGGEAAPKKTGKMRQNDDPPSQEDIDKDAWVAAILDPIREDLDSPEPKVAAAAARKIMAHVDAAVRSKAVEALAGTGSEGLRELAAMVRDRDPGVAAEAREAWALSAQSEEDMEARVASINEVAETAMLADADAFQDVLDAMFDLPDDVALDMLQVWAAQAENPEVVEKILGDVNFRAQPENEVEKKEDVPQAVEDWKKQKAFEDAMEAADADE